MDWARDQSGNLIHATERSLYAFWLSCPACGEPVFKRSGSNRRQHFAHYGHSGRLECENYHPLNVISKSSSHLDWNEAHPKSSTLSTRGGIYLEQTERKRYYIHVKLPQLQQGVEISGSIKIQSPLGELSYTSSKLQRPCSVKVYTPRVPLIDIESTGELAWVGAAIKQTVTMFRATNNYFRPGEGWSRLLGTEAPLEWGERYQLLTKQPLNPVPKSIEIGIQGRDEQYGWCLYEIVLPKATQIRSQIEMDAIARYLGREVRNQSARAYFVDPPPHHIEPDGTHVFQVPTDRILIARTERRPVAIIDTPSHVAHAKVTDITDKWVEITGIKTGSFSILLDGNMVLLGRVEECPLFQPEGVRIVIGDVAHDIFEPGLKGSIWQDSRESLRILCPSRRVADSLTLSKEIWIREGVSYALCGDNYKDIDAGNFGALAWPIPERSSSEAMGVDLQIPTRDSWLEGVVTRIYGHDISKRLINRSAETSPVTINSELAWLRPYIIRAQSS